MRSRTTSRPPTGWRPQSGSPPSRRERTPPCRPLSAPWLASRPTVTSVIAGATRPEQVRQNAQAIGWVPSAEDEAALDQIFPPVDKVALF